MSYVILYVTTGNAGEASLIGETLVKEKLAACANVLGPSAACYYWKGKLERLEEHMLLLKTRRALADKAMARVKALHSYEVPCIVVVPIEGGNLDFLAWIDAETMS